jgi:cytochrome c551/c552
MDIRLQVGLVFRDAVTPLQVLKLQESRMLHFSRTSCRSAGLAIAVASNAMTGPVLAQADVEKMLKDANCVQCHHPSRQLIGPSWATIASRYKGSDASELLLRRIKEGSKGKHGVVSMPACVVGIEQYTEAEQRQIVDYILRF